MTNEHIVRLMGPSKPKGILKGEDNSEKLDASMVIGEDFRTLVLDMKQMVDGDLAQKA